ncbi:MAG: sulfatase [Opitutales bacterium]|jgi:arylsulfatase A|nr:sulfatase [Opitutales bacterium]
MNRYFIRKCLSFGLGLVLAILIANAVTAAPAQPNIILLFADDLGYGDLGCFGAEGYSTPHLDRVAAEGTKFTSFYVAAAGCAPSRAALLTGCYPPRVAGTGLGSPFVRTGLNPDEVTLAEMLKQVGYRTACIGKWHQGWAYQFLPLQQGFDSFYGLPYSHDMSPLHAVIFDKYPLLPLLRDNDILQLSPNPNRFTADYTDEAIYFIKENREKPFFLYLCYSLPHVPLHVSDAFRGKTERGMYGDVVTEIDASVGRISDTLRQFDLYENTLVVFTSDNGPWLSYGDHGGSAGPLREGKGTTFEGGMREPCVMRWPAKMPAGQVCDEVVSTMDFMPTFAAISGGQSPTDRVIDGKDITPLFEGRPDAQSPHEAFYYFNRGDLQAVRSGRWKLHFPHSYRAGKGKRPSHGIPVPYSHPKIGLSLFDLEADIGETNNIADQHPDVVARLTLLADKIRIRLGDEATGIRGTEVRPVGRMSQEQFDNRRW